MHHYIWVNKICIYHSTHSTLIMGHISLPQANSLEAAGVFSINGHGGPILASLLQVSAKEFHSI